MNNGLLLLVRLSISVAIVAAAVWIGWSVGGKVWALVALVSLTPIVGVAIARPLVEFIHEGFGWLAASPMSKWQGNYYEFDNVQVRVYDDGERLWFCARDVLAAAGLPRTPDGLLDRRHGECATIPGTRMVGFTIAGLERFAAGKSPDANRLLHWAQREVVGPWKKTRGA